MDRLSEIRARCDAAKEEKRKGNALDCACLSWAVVLNDVPYLLEQLTLSKAREHPRNLFLELTPQQRAENAEIVALTARAEKAEAAIADAAKLIATMRNNKKAALWLKKYGPAEAGDTP